MDVRTSKEVHIHVPTSSAIILPLCERYTRHVPQEAGNNQMQSSVILC